MDICGVVESTCGLNMCKMYANVEICGGVESTCGEVKVRILIISPHVDHMWKKYMRKMVHSMHLWTYVVLWSQYVEEWSPHVEEVYA